jgi:nucleoside-diphosphate-sugar epimerase
VTAHRDAAGRPHLVCFGCGYSAQALARRLIREGWRVTGTCRLPEHQDPLIAAGIEPLVFDGTQPLADAPALLADATDLLVSVPPGAASDPVLGHHAADIAAAVNLRWIGYLSTTGVYGDTGGAAVDEASPLNPTGDRSRRRIAAERAWLDLLNGNRRPVHVFRLAGIYGPGRSPFEQIRAGQARRIDKPGHVFSRVHVTDIVCVLRASMAKPDPGRVYNVCDDEPAEPAAVIEHACRLLGVEPPPLIPFDVAFAEMSPMAQSFWRDHRRVDNGRIKHELGIMLTCPNYRVGLARILEAERSS